MLGTVMVLVKYLYTSSVYLCFIISWQVICDHLLELYSEFASVKHVALGERIF